jgi:hypothetical protein
MRGERALGAGAHVVEALDDERRLLGDGALELGAEPAVARGGEPRPQGVALGGIGLIHGGGVLALEGAASSRSASPFAVTAQARSIRIR